MAWSPLRGNIFSNLNDSKNQRVFEIASSMTSKYSTTVSAIFLAWLYTHPSGIVPVLGTSQIERIIEAKEAKQIKLSKEDWFTLLEASRGKEVA